MASWKDLKMVYLMVEMRLEHKTWWEEKFEQTMSSLETKSL